MLLFDEYSVVLRLAFPVLMGKDHVFPHDIVFNVCIMKKSLQTLFKRFSRIIPMITKNRYHRDT